MYNNKSLISTPRERVCASGGAPEVTKVCHQMGSHDPSCLNDQFNPLQNSKNDLVHIHTKLGNLPVANINPIRLEKSSDIAMLRIERWALHAVSKILLTELIKKCLPWTESECYLI